MAQMEKLRADFKNADEAFKNGLAELTSEFQEHQQKETGRVSFFAQISMAAFAKPLLPAGRIISRNLIQRQNETKEINQKVYYRETQRG